MKGNLAEKSFKDILWIKYPGVTCVIDYLNEDF